MRSFLFVPGDSVRKFESAKKTAADALILDLEDSIAPDQKVIARGITRGMLDARHPSQKIYIRVNALDTGMTLGDLAAVMPGRPDGIVLPKCAGAADVNHLALYLDAFEAASDLEHGSTRIVVVATETARAVLKLLDFEDASPRLWGMMWGAEDLAASLGASRNRPLSRSVSAGARSLSDQRGGGRRRRDRYHRHRHRRSGRAEAGGDCRPA
jgi:citrate lyase subunit beta / citryl-CoA lyase